MAELNFLPPKRLILEQDKRLQRRLLIASSIILILTVIVSAVVWVYSTNLKQSVIDLAGQKLRLSQELEANRGKIQKLSNIHQKSLGIKKIFALQFNYSKVLAGFFQNIPDGINIDSLVVTNDGTVQSNLVASNSGSLKNLVAQISRPENNYSLIELGNISLQNKTNFNLSVSFKVKPPK